MRNRSIPFLFIIASLISLIAGLLFGVIGGLQYIIPDFLIQQLAFYKTRPLHVMLVITWIFNAAIGGIYYYLPEAVNKKLFSEKLARIHFYLFVFNTLAIIVCYLLGYFGGREYLEYPPIMAIPIAISWILLMINFFKTISGKIKTWPVYFWMWTTGIIFYLITFTESYLWLIPFFRDNIVRDVTVQWKASGSMVGSWNMLVYGTAFYLMDKISGHDKISRSPSTFFFYFLGLTNLMFNWGHHTYIVPAESWVKNVSYIISMTELLILGNIILSWKKTVNAAIKNYYIIPYRFLLAADVWIFLNLILAIIISVPAINLYTHGTHITVAHAMGATIGINTMILLASVFYILSVENENFIPSNINKMNAGFWVTNISLLVFWISLIAAGIIKAMQMQLGVTANFREVMDNLSTVFHVFTFAGITLFIGILFLVLPAVKKFSGMINKI